MTDALEESKMPQTSAAEPPKIETEDVQAELRKLRADKKEQAQKVGKLESAVDVEIDVATSLSKHLQHCVKRDKSHQKDVMERIAAVNKALDDFPKIESMPEIEAFETKTLSELTDSDSAGELIDDLRKRISDLESMIKRLATTAGIAVDETKQDMEYLAELVQESTENFLFIKHQLASMKPSLLDSIFLTPPPRTTNCRPFLTSSFATRFKMQGTPQNPNIAEATAANPLKACFKDMAAVILKLRATKRAQAEMIKTLQARINMQGEQLNLFRLATEDLVDRQVASTLYLKRDLDWALKRLEAMQATEDVVDCESVSTLPPKRHLDQGCRRVEEMRAMLQDFIKNTVPDTESSELESSADQLAGATGVPIEVKERLAKLIERTATRRERVLKNDEQARTLMEQVHNKRRQLGLADLQGGFPVNEEVIAADLQQLAAHEDELDEDELVAKHY
ncbi:hypothetical protein BKA80DRAFT_336126 [Phyllosticta citrichinensis]